MSVRVITGDCREVLRTLPDESVHCVVTSPPYWGLRDYGTARWDGGDDACAHEIVDTQRTAWANDVPGPNGRVKNTAAGHWRPKETGGYCAKCGATRIDQGIGLEATLAEHIESIVDVFREVRRVLRSDGTCWINYGDAYAGSWGAQSREHAGKHGPNVSALSANQVKAAQKRTCTGSAARTPGLKAKDRMLLPARLAIALCDDGWWVRDEIIWHKPNPMPSPGRGRTTPAHEMIYMLTKSAQYEFDQEAFKEPAAVADWDDGSRVYGGVNKAGANAKHGDRTTGRRTGKVKGAGGHGTIHRGGRTSAEYVEAQISAFRNKRSVWTVATQPFSEAHFATFPPALIEPCILAGCPRGGVVLDPFGGAGTTGLVADRLGRDAILIELNPAYADMARGRITGDAPLLAQVAAS